jgi:hypothetical protein
MSGDSRTDIVVTLPPGARLVVRLHETDGEFVIANDFGSDGKLTVEVDLPDDSGRKGVIYQEDYFRGHVPEDDAVPVAPEKP